MLMGRAMAATLKSLSWGWDLAARVERLPATHEALNSIPGSAQSRCETSGL